MTTRIFIAPLHGRHAACGGAVRAGTFALAATFNGETITLQILLFAAAVVATVAISTRTRGRRVPAETVIPGRLAEPNPESRDSPMCNCTS
jgi:hypothetical protein